MEEKKQIEEQVTEFWTEFSIERNKRTMLDEKGNHDKYESYSFLPSTPLPLS
jgi:hypothetical protein